MVCPTVTIPGGISLTIATIISSMDNINEPQTRTFTVSGTGSGLYQIKEGNIIITSRNLVNGNDFFTLKNISYGSHTYCTVPAASTGCETFLIEELLPPTRWSCSNNCATALQVGAYATQADCITGCSQPADCSTLTKDTWKPVTTNPKTGENLAITVRSNEVNKTFNIGYADAITLERHVLMSGTTDAQGCCTGEIPAQADGVYNLTVCFLVLNIACPITAPIVPISITWGAKPMDLQTMALIGAGILGLAYVLGQQRK